MGTLTVLICTHNRVQLLEKTLGSLEIARRHADWAVEVLVVANACDDGTHELLERLAQAPPSSGKLPLSWIAEPRRGKSNALNRVLPTLRGDLVAMVDDDHRVDDDYLVAVCRAADAHPATDFICGRILPDWDGSEPEWVHDRGPFRIYPLPVPLFDQGPAVRKLSRGDAVPGGGNLVFRTPWALRVGEFATDMGPVGHDLGGAEDLEWVMRAQRLGAKLTYVPDIVQYHYVDRSRLTLPYLMRKAYKRSASSMALKPVVTKPGVPAYAYRKVAEYGLQAVTALTDSKRRFYLVRTAAALGEFAGHLARRQAAIRHPSIGPKEGT